MIDLSWFWVGWEERERFRERGDEREREKGQRKRQTALIISRHTQIKGELMQSSQKIKIKEEEETSIAFKKAIQANLCTLEFLCVDERGSRGQLRGEHPNETANLV